MVFLQIQVFLLFFNLFIDQLQNEVHLNEVSFLFVYVNLLYCYLNKKS